MGARVPSLDPTSFPNTILFMATTIHVPDEILERVDTRAKALGVSRNRVILDALEASLGANVDWPPELVRMLEHPASAPTAELLEETLAAARARRIGRRRPPRL
jgi:hypothetical protein